MAASLAGFISKGKTVRTALLLTMVLGLMIFPRIAAAAPYLDVLENMAEDIEEIHEDMHKVVFFLKILAYASVAQGVLLVPLVYGV